MIFCDTRCPQTISFFTPGVCRRLYQKPNFILQDFSVFFILLRVENATTVSVSEGIWREMIPSFHWRQLCENPNVTFLLINSLSHGIVFLRFHLTLGFTPLHYIMFFGGILRLFLRFKSISYVSNFVNNISLTVLLCSNFT